MRLCWLVPDDHGGGVISVAISCVRRARAAGHDAVILLIREPTGWLAEVVGIRILSLGLEGEAKETPAALMRWLEANPQDILLLNGGEQADPVIPYLPPGLRCLYVVHDTAARYWRDGVASELELDGIVAVSHAIADKFKDILKAPDRLRVIHNGSVFPSIPDLTMPRPDDIIFLGGSSLAKGAFDVLRLWPKLLEDGFAGRLHWFGHTEDAFERRIAELPDEHRIMRRGRTRRDAIFDVAGASKVLLMLSRVEPFGMATIEGMGMGCVPVAWDIRTGTKEIVTPETGFFAPLGDFKTLARQVMRACTQYNWLAPIAVRRAREIFGEDVMWQGYASLFHDVMRNSSQPRSRNEQPPPDFIPALRRFQLLPASLRRAVRYIVGRSPRLGYLLRDLRGW